MLPADGWYDRTRPWNSLPEQIVSEQLAENATAEASPGWINKMPLFPERFGYERRALDVADCFAIETQYGDARNNYSRVTSGYSGSSTPSMPVT